MSFGGSSSRSPEKLPSPKPADPPVTMEDEESRTAAERERRRLSNAGGRRSTNLIEATNPYAQGAKSTLG